VLGVVNEKGRVTYVDPPLQLDASLVEVLKRRPSPEARFRFASSCIEGSCSQWHDGSCGIIKLVTRHAEGLAAHGPLPKCGIRKTCRWFAQEGRRACEVCPLVVTDQAASVSWRSHEVAGLSRAGGDQ
jgi:hypothetical protein